jgi:hypothetical protein
MALLLVAIAALSPSVARATEEDGKTFFAEGRRLRLAGDCFAAIDVFRRALAAWPDGLGSLRNLAECQEELGMVASARRSYWDLRREVLRVGADKYKGWDAEAEQAHARLGSRVARLLVRLETTEPRRVRVTIDGEHVPPELVGTELERDPGTHDIEAVAGANRVRESVILGQGERRAVSLRIASDGSRGRRRGLSGPMIGAIATLSIAGVGAVGMGISGGLRQRALSDLESVCSNYAEPQALCPAEARDPIDRGKRAATMFNAFTAVTGAAAVVGATLLIVATTRTEVKPAGSVWIAPVHAGAMMAGEVRF